MGEREFQRSRRSKEELAAATREFIQDVEPDRLDERVEKFIAKEG